MAAYSSSFVRVFSTVYSAKRAIDFYEPAVNEKLCRNPTEDHVWRRRRDIFAFQDAWLPTTTTIG